MGAAAVLRAGAVGHVVVGGRRSLLLAADEADDGAAEEEQHGGGPADVDGGAHLPLQGSRHKGVVVDGDGRCRRPADRNQAEDASEDTQRSTQQTCLGEERML